MNIAMEQTEEYVNGQLKNKYGDAFIRGNNGIPFSSISSIFFLVLSRWIWFEFLSPPLWMQFSISAPQKGLLRTGHDGAAVKFQFVHGVPKSKNICSSI